MKYTFTSILGVGVAKAASSGSIGPVGSAPSSGDSISITGILQQVADNAINIIFVIAGIAAVFYILWAGIQYINSAGDPTKTKTARGTIINAVAGVVILMAAWVIVRFAVSLGTKLVGGI